MLASAEGGGGRGVLVITNIFGDRKLNQSDSGLNPWEVVELTKVISEMEDTIVLSTGGTGPLSVKWGISRRSLNMAFKYLLKLFLRMPINI